MAPTSTRRSAAPTAPAPEQLRTASATTRTSARTRRSTCGRGWSATSSRRAPRPRASTSRCLPADLRRRGPKFRGIQIPIDFWKVVVAVTKQEQIVRDRLYPRPRRGNDEFGTAEAAVRVPFGAYGTYQRPISTIENDQPKVHRPGDPKAPKSLALSTRSPRRCGGPAPPSRRRDRGSVRRRRG